MRIFSSRLNIIFSHFYFLTHIKGTIFSGQVHSHPLHPLGYAPAHTQCLNILKTFISSANRIMEKEIYCQILEQVNSSYNSFKFLNQITSLASRTPQYCQNLDCCLICNTFFIYFIIPNLHAPWQLFLFLELQVLNNNPILIKSQRSFLPE